MRPIWQGPAAVLLALVAAVAPARADDLRHLAAEQFELAAAAEQRGDFGAAVEAYRRAYAIVPHADVLYNLARCFEKLGDWPAAAEHYQRYLDEGGDPEDRAEVERRIAALRDRAGQPGGELIIQSNLPGAEVLVDGETVGVTPLQRPAAAGRRTVTVVYPGFETATVEVDLEPGGVRVVRADLQPTPGPLSLSLGLSLGYEHLGGSGVRFGTWTGIRPRGSRFEGNLLFLFGRDLSLGLEARLHARREPGGLYGRAAATGGFTTSGGGLATGAEVAAGYAWSTRGPATVELGLEIGYRLLRLSGSGNESGESRAGPIVQGVTAFRF
jgi:hypothetical protein